MSRTRREPNDDVQKQIARLKELDNRLRMKTPLAYEATSIELGALREDLFALQNELSSNQESKLTDTEQLTLQKLKDCLNDYCELAEEAILRNDTSQLANSDEFNNVISAIRDAFYEFGIEPKLHVAAHGAYGTYNDDLLIPSSPPPIPSNEIPNAFGTYQDQDEGFPPLSVPGYDRVPGYDKAPGVENTDDSFKPPPPSEPRPNSTDMVIPTEIQERLDQQIIRNAEHAEKKPKVGHLMGPEEWSSIDVDGDTPRVNFPVKVDIISPIQQELDELQNDIDALKALAKLHSRSTLKKEVKALQGMHDDLVEKLQNTIQEKQLGTYINTNEDTIKPALDKAFQHAERLTDRKSSSRKPPSSRKKQQQTKQSTRSSRNSKKASSATTKHSSTSRLHGTSQSGLFGRRKLGDPVSRKNTIPQADRPKTPKGRKH